MIKPQSLRMTEPQSSHPAPADGIESFEGFGFPMSALLAPPPLYAAETNKGTTG
jgi:hypothetical protein